MHVDLCIRKSGQRSTGSKTHRLRSLQITCGDNSALHEIDGSYRRTVVDQSLVDSSLSFTTIRLAILDWQ